MSEATAHPGEEGGGALVERMLGALRDRGGRITVGRRAVAEVLVDMHRDTQMQRGTLEEARKTPGLVERAVRRDMLAAYCSQRADLRGYQRMLDEWGGPPAEPDVRSAVAMLLAAVLINRFVRNRAMEVRR